MTRISNIQLFVLIIAFEVGSTTLFALGIGAKQDAWIVIIFAALVGLGLLWVFTEIPKKYPNQNFAEILNEALGKKLAAPLLFLFGLYFFSQAGHNFFEFGVLIKMTALEQTPLIVILYLFILVMIYILNLGIEILARTTEILLPYFLIFLISIYFLTLFSGQFDLGTLRPVLGNGIQPILGELHNVIAFPFGEMVVFLMFWHYVNKPQLFRRTAFLGVSLSAIILTISLIVMISVLGPELAANTEIPLLETVLAINIAEIITNLDSIAVFIMFIGGFYKTALHFYGFALTMTWLFNSKKTELIVTIVGLLFPIFVLQRFPEFDDQRWIGSEMGIYSILLFSFISVLLLIIIIIKKRKDSFSKKRDNNDIHSDNLKS